jgi:lipid II:glycine glycyltransferase (peptidoglycan interpeptide bridge formation enzyme)
MKEDSKLSEVQTFSIFQENWWLNAVSPKSWEVIEIEQDNKLVARLPYVVEKKFGFTKIGQPQLTQTLGPWIEQEFKTNSEKLSREHSLYKQIIRELPKFDYFHQNFHPEVSNWLPFYWEGFNQTTRYTYEISDLTNLNALYSSLPKKQRWIIRKAEQTLNVITDADIESILDMATHTFERQGKKLPYERDLLHTIDQAVTQFGFRESILIVDDYGEIHSGGYVVGDERRSYLIVSGQNEKFRGSGAGELLHWKLICEAAKKSSVFDFEGSMLSGVERFYRQFSSSQVPYLSIEKKNIGAKIALNLSQVVRKH